MSRKTLDFVKKIDTWFTATVSGHGGGLYLYIPKNVARAHEITVQDRIEVKLLRHYKPTPAGE